jgi:hypothetical protein
MTIVDDPELLELLRAAVQRSDVELVFSRQIECETTVDEEDGPSRRIARFDCSEEEVAEFARLGFLRWLEGSQSTIELKEYPVTPELLNLEKSISKPPPDVSDVSEFRRLLCVWAALLACRAHMSDDTVVAPETTRLFQLEPGDWPYLAEALVLGDWQAHPDPMTRVSQLAKNIKYRHEKDGILNSKGKVDVQQAYSLESLYPPSEQEINPAYDTAVGRALIAAARTQLKRLEHADLEKIGRDLNLNAEELKLLVARSQGKMQARDAPALWRNVDRKIAKARKMGRLAASVERNFKTRVVAAEPVSDASLTYYEERVGAASIWQHKNLNLDW